MTEELKQPEALRLADWLQACAESIEHINAANELRRLHALTQRPAAQTEREAFEAEMRREETWGHRSLKKRPDGRYQNWMVDVMWGVWQARAALPAPQQATPQLEADWISNVIRDVSELPDRSSPDDEPDMMLVTAEELRSILEGHTPQQATPASGNILMDAFNEVHALKQQATTEPTKAELIAQARDLIEAQEHAHEVGYRMGFAATTERKGEPPEGEFFAFDPEGGNAFYKTRQEAINHAKESLKYYRDGANDHGEWDEDVEHVRWGVVMQRAKATNVSATEDGESSCDYELQDAATRPAPGGPEDFALVQQATERKGEPVTYADMGTWLWIKLADYCRRKGLNPHHENDLFNLAGELRAMLAGKSPQVPEGFALVPVEPTPAMKSAGIEVEIYNEADDRIGALTWHEVASIYRAMLDAARKGE